jgi:tRNA(fMet)-specific endonuclease VapC
MTRFMLDTGIAGHYLNLRRGVFERARIEVAAGNRIGVCVPVLGELVYGIEYSRSRDANWQDLRRALSAWTVWPYEKGAAEEYGRLYADLRRRGRPMQQIDVQIAAIALTIGQCVVVTTDSDFAAVPGLTVENWTK